MRYRLFGRSGLRVSQVVLGTMTFGEDWGWGAGPEVCRDLVRAYREAGGNAVDTASQYTDGASEQIVGELIADDRDYFVLSTKYSLTLDGTDANAAGNSRKSLVRSLEQSLRRLRTDRIDLLWVHIWDPDTPVEETMRALDDVVRAGKVLYVGISDAPAWVVAHANTLADWRGWSPFIGLHVPYSLVQREVERELLPMAAAFGLSVAAWSPLAGGVLSGKFTRSADAGATRVNRTSISERDLAIARTVDAVADDLGLPSAQVALAWVLSRPGVHPILGARRVEQLLELLPATGLVLPLAAVKRLDQATAVELGFPTDFIRSTTDFVYGPVGRQVDSLKGGRW